MYPDEKSVTSNPRIDNDPAKGLLHRLKPVSRCLRSIAVVLFTQAFLVACDDATPVKIGFIGGLSGPSADIGEASRNAVQMAVENLNKAGGFDGRMVEVLIRDDENSPQVAAEAVRNLHAAGVSAIIGPNNSSIAEGMLPVLNELKVVTVSPTVSSLVFADLDDYFFRVNWTTRDNARIYAKHYADAGLRRVAAAVDANNRVFSESWLKEFSDAFKAEGGEVVTSDSFDRTSDRGYSDTARLLLGRDAEAILMVANGVDTAQLSQQIRKLDKDILLIAAEWAASEKLLNLGGSAIEGLEVVQSYDRNDQSPGYLEFRKAYLEQFQQQPGYSSIAAYDAATMLFAGMMATNGKTEGLREALPALNEISGLQQPLKFNTFGDAKRQAFFVVVKDGKFQPL